MNSLKIVRLVVGAAEVEAAHLTVPDESLAEVQAARAELELMRGSDVVDAILACRRSGLPLAISFSAPSRVTSGGPERPLGRRF